MTDLTKIDRAELEQTATDLGVKFRSDVTDDTLRKKISEQLGDTSAPAPAEPEQAKKYEIVIQTDSRDKQPVQVGVNGKMFVIKRGEKVVVPASVVEVLNNAVRYEYDPSDMARTEVLSYPFQIIRTVE